MKIVLFLLTLITFYPFAAFSQVSVNGKVTDLQGHPLTGVFISVKQNTILKASTATDAKGSYHFLFPGTGKQLITFSFTNYISKSFLLNPQKDTVINTQLEPQTVQLKEVKIKKNIPVIERKVDRLVFNIGDNTSLSASNVLELLQMAPGVRLVDNAISLAGKGGVNIMIDDRMSPLKGEDLISFLKTISAENVSKIEIITNPPAKYDAEGNSGLINIKLKKAMPDSWNASLMGTYTQTTYAAGTFGGNFNYQKGVLSFYTNNTANRGSMLPVQTNRIFYPENLWSEINREKSTSNSFGSINGLDLRLNSKWTMGIQYAINHNKPFARNDNKVSLINYQTNTIDSLIYSESTNKRKNILNSYNWHSIYTIDTSGKKVSLDFDFLNYSSSNDLSYFTNHLTNQELIIPGTFSALNNIGQQEIDNYSGKADVELPFRRATISFGGKISFTKNSSDMQIYNTASGSPIQNGEQDSFRYRENTQSIYLSGSKKMSGKWEMQAGLRMEATQSNGQSLSTNELNDKKYISFFPTAYLTYTATPDHSFSLSYGRRINRPPFRWLNPFKWYNSVYSYQQGSPSLQPSYANNFELSYSFKDCLISNIYFSKTTNGFGYLNFTDSTQFTQKVQPLNYFSTSLIGISESYTFKTWKWLESYSSFDLYYSRSKSSVPLTNSNLNGINSYFSLTNNFKLNNRRTIFLNTNYWFNFPGTINLNRNNTFQEFDISMKLLLFDKKYQLTAGGNDIFKSRQLIQTSYVNGIKQQFKNYEDNRSFRITISYKFGNKLLNVKERQIGNTDEKNRVR